MTGLTGFTGGQNTQQSLILIWNTYQAYDDANLTIGRHSIKFGGGVERDQEKNRSYIAPGGSFAFGSLTNFLENLTPTTYTLFLANPPPLRYYRDSIFGAYVQDDIRWRPNLTINLGVRYEMMAGPTEKDSKFANLNSLTDSTPRLGSFFVNNPTLRNFDPRVGVAWDPFGNGKTSVRAGFGIFDVLPLPYEWFITEDNLAPYSIWLKVSSPGANTFPSGAYLPTINTALPSQSYLQASPPRNYIMQWNLSLQREVLSGLTVTVSYTGARGVHDFFMTYDANQVLPTSLTASGYIWPNPIGSGVVPNSHYAHIYYQSWGYDNTYHGLQTQVTKQMRHGFQVQGAFTWSKSTDGSDGAGTANRSPTPYKG